MNRTELLKAAEAIVNGQRQEGYGSPEDSFTSIAAYWQAYLGCPIRAADVAVMMALLKIARLSNDITHADSWIDLIGYAACGGAIAIPATLPERAEEDE